MRIELLRKIKALADDERGHPEVRQRAQEKLDSYRGSHPFLFEDLKPKSRMTRPDPRVHGMRTDPAYEHFVFANLGLWDRTKSGNNLTHTIYYGGVTYRIVLFQHKKTPTWGWMRVPIDISGAEPTFSVKFRTMGEAHADAWRDLTTN